MLEMRVNGGNYIVIHGDSEVRTEALYAFGVFVQL